MTDTIHAGTVLIEEGAPLPESLRFESEPFSNGRRLVSHFDGAGLDRRIREAGRSSFYGALWQQAPCLLFLYLVAVVACASAQTESTVPTVETIIARMAQARAENRAHFRPYIITREYQFFGKERHKTKSQVIADITFVPPDFKKYATQQSDGSGLGERIVRRMLESEAALAKDSSSSDLSRDNYDFRFIREEGVSGQRCYVLELLPRRKDKNLLRGNIWVDANTHLLHRAEGEPARNPSWWLRDVRIVLLYAGVGGMWLQTASEVTANVRILGQSTIVSHDVKYNVSELVAARPSVQRSF
jgi:hypothetical protein